jgi:membrane-associated phospholipid phosphatase
VKTSGALIVAIVVRTGTAHADPTANTVPTPTVHVDGSSSEHQLEWKPEWSRASAVDYVVTGAGLTAALVSAILPPQPTHTYGGVLFDDAVRDALRLPTYDQRHAAGDASDVILSLVTTYPIVFDGFALGYGYWRSADAAYQMTVIDAEVLAITAGVQGIANVSASRERPYGQDCGTQLSSALAECNGPTRYRSFFSGHASVSFASAGLTCSHHLHLHLFGNGADVVACVAALVAASAVSVLRVMADVHYTTDVLTGALVGTAVGFGVPAFHYAHHKRGKPTSTLEWHIAPSIGGVGVAGTW